MLKQRLIELLIQAVSQAQESGKLPSVTLPEVTIERPQNPEHGDYASSFPLKLARTIGINPLTIANDIVALIVPACEIDSIAVAPPGVAVI
jgi:arginyl-tRNA synthetase